MAELVVTAMQEAGTNFVRPSVPTSITPSQGGGGLRVEWKNSETTETGCDVFDTVLVAVGRCKKFKYNLYSPHQKIFAWGC